MISNPSDPTPADGSITKAKLAESSLYAQEIPLLAFRNNGGTPMTTPGGSGKFSVAYSGPSSGMQWYGSSASGNTQTDVAIAVVTLDPEYLPGQDIQIIVRGNFFKSGTVTVKTVDVAFYKLANSGSSGGVTGLDLCQTSAQAMTDNAYGEYAFVIDPTGLVAGDRFLLTITTVVTEHGGDGYYAYSNPTGVQLVHDRTV